MSEPQRTLTLEVGFTGTRFSMTDAQEDAFRDELRDYVLGLNPWRFHHGDCIGADAQAHEIVKQAGGITVAHPCDIVTQRAYCAANVVHPPLPPLTRNRVIVNDTSVLFATPQTGQGLIRSGTWSTIRYARKLERPICIIYRTGEIAWERR